MENGVELGVFGRNRFPKERLFPFLFEFDLLGSTGEALFDESPFRLLGSKGEFSSNGSPVVGPRSGLIRFSLIDAMLTLDLGAGLEGRLFGAGGGDGYGLHKGVIGELITTSVLLD